MREVRYRGERNGGGRWRAVLGLDDHAGVVLDFGCGNGIESLELALAGNKVSIADICEENLDLAERIFQLHGLQPMSRHLVLMDTPYLRDGSWPWGFDRVHMSGVLHHIPWARAVMERVHDLLVPHGDVRLLLYSDTGWRVATGTEPPDDVTRHPEAARFVRFFDDVGTYADWYSAARLEQRFGDLFALSRCEYLMPDNRFLGAVLRRRL
jgi:SAM-dependent methyltransferase